MADAAAARRQRLSAAMGIGYCEGDPRSGVFLFDETAARLLDLAAGVPLPISECLSRIHPRDLLAIEKIAAELMASGDSAEADFRYGRSGQARSLNATACVERDAAGQVVHMTIGLRDITAARRTRSELRDVKQRFSVLIENVDDVFWIVDWQPRRQIYVSPSYSRCWGFDEAALLAGKSRWVDKIHRADRAAAAAAFEALGEAEEGDDHFAIEYRIVLDNGEQRWIRDRAIAVRASDGSIERVVGIAEDITDRRTVVRELNEREQNLHQAMEAAQLHVWTLHSPTRRLKISDALCAMFGLNSEACRRLGPWRRRLHPKDRVRVEAALRKLMADGVPLREEFRVQRVDGSITWLDARAILIADEDGQGAEVHGVAADITERKQLEQMQAASGRRLQLALDAAHLFAWTYEPATGRVDGDDGIYPLFFGEEKKAVYTTEDWRAAIHPEDWSRVADAFAETLAGGAEFDAEYRVIRRDKSVRWVRSQLVLVRNEEGSSFGYGVLGDITERRRVEQQLRHSERELRTITAAVPIGIARIGSDLRYQFMNQAFAALMRSTTPDLFVGRSIAEVAGEEALAAIRPYIDQVLSGQTADYQTRVQLPIGERYIHANYTPEWNEAGEVTGFIAVIMDITDRTLAEGKLYEREREFETLAENAPDLIARVDRDLAYLYINRVAESAFGINREAYVGLTAEDLSFPAQYVSATSEIITAAFALGVEQSTSFSLPHGRERSYFSARAVPELDRAGMLESVLLIVYDISERMRGQAERETVLAREHEARKQAEASARGRDEFLAIVSHEMRSPLNGIQNWAHVLESVPGNSNKLMLRAIAGIKIGVEQQVRLIDDLLDATRIITGKLSLLLTPVKLVPVIAASIASVRDKALAKHIELHTEIELGDEAIEGDADRLQQIVWNLLSNAIKFTPSGGNVWLSASRENDIAVIRIRDDGRGIDGDFLPQLFERFRRDETGNSRGQGGLGLGLMLVRNLCELHRGSVVATSPGPGLGAVFTVRLPLRKSGTAAVSAIVPFPLDQAGTLPSLSGLRLLLVDDHVESRDPLAVLLSQTGAAVDVLSSGEEAVRLIRQGFADEPPDLLICDIAMPGQDGYETVRLIREFEQSRGQPTMPAIALTAFAQNEDRARALEAGFQTHIAKPVVVKELIATIASLAPVRGNS
ncbi:PAS domain-containing protein [uncultured Nevskia sp.]|uniref:PAS domain-containing protein n=1 Tax=uncultured Nevskia sp. TaxID=228950 RepID=UPI0025FCAC57|nr:PAS domain-containing protein [uncultured Nevskia sp.]